MTNSFLCPYCGITMPVTTDTSVTRYPSFACTNDRSLIESRASNTYTNSCVALTFNKCPACGQFSLSIKGMGHFVEDVDMQIRPHSLAKQYPAYIPLAIRNDYEEACAIVNLSPKASATLSRRCLQGMIRDFWNINESNLAKAIEKLQNKIPSTQWQVIDGIRRIGNIGAHMEKDINLIVDIEPDEAQKLIKLIEHLLEHWYIDKYETQQLYSDIIGIDELKQSERKKTE